MWEMLQLSKKSQNLPKKCIESKKKLNHLMILNIFEEETEELNLAEVANDFFYV